MKIARRADLKIGCMLDCSILSTNPDRRDIHHMFAVKDRNSAPASARSETATALGLASIIRLNAQKTVHILTNRKTVFSSK